MRESGFDTAHWVLLVLFCGWGQREGEREFSRRDATACSRLDWLDKNPFWLTRPHPILPVPPSLILDGALEELRVCQPMRCLRVAGFSRWRPLHGDLIPLCYRCPGRDVLLGFVPAKHPCDRILGRHCSLHENALLKVWRLIKAFFPESKNCLHWLLSL